MRFPPEYDHLPKPARRQGVHNCAPMPAARSSPTPAQRELDAARKAAFDQEIRRIVAQQLAAAEPQPALSPMQSLHEAAGKLDPVATWDRALDAVHKRYGYAPAEPVADAPSPPIAAAAAPSFKHALASVDADQLWARAIEQARRGGTIRQS